MTGIVGLMVFGVLTPVTICKAVIQKLINCDSHPSPRITATRAKCPIIGNGFCIRRSVLHSSSDDWSDESLLRSGSRRNLNLCNFFVQCMPVLAYLVCPN